MNMAPAVPPDPLRWNYICTQNCAYQTWACPNVWPKPHRSGPIVSFIPWLATVFSIWNISQRNRHSGRRRTTQCSDRKPRKSIRGNSMPN